MIGQEQSVLAKGVFRRAFLNVFGSWEIAIRIKHFFFSRALKEVIRGDKLVMLDVGCGRGMFSFYLARVFPGAQVIGLDLSEDNIDACQRIKNGKGYANVTFMVGDALEMEFSQDFDVVVCQDVLEHILDDHLAMAKIRDALKEGGKLILHVPLVPQRRHFKRLESWAQANHVRPGYTVDDLNSLLEQNSFIVEKSLLTFGWFGALAWEIYTLAFRRKSLFIGLFPLLLSLGWLDSRLTNGSWGNCILIVGTRST